MPQGWGRGLPFVLVGLQPCLASLVVVAKSAQLRRDAGFAALGFAGGDSCVLSGNRHRSRITQCGQSGLRALQRSEEHTSELQSLMRISYAVFCLKKQTYKETREK